MVTVLISFPPTVEENFSTPHLQTGGGAAVVVVVITGGLVFMLTVEVDGFGTAGAFIICIICIIIIIIIMDIE